VFCVLNYTLDIISILGNDIVVCVVEIVLVTVGTDSDVVIFVSVVVIFSIIQTIPTAQYNVFVLELTCTINYRW
jgi:hypothetical protein